MSYVELADDKLLAQCEVDTYRASGPGGQKRNKTSSAVRLRHRPTGVSASATESRSQHENKARALRRLRTKLAVELRAPVDLAAWRPPPAVQALLEPGARRSEKARREPAYWAAVQALLDLFEALGCSVADTAARVGLGSAALSKLLFEDDEVGRAVNRMRAARGLRPLS